ncbi:uncharacterized protein LOC105847596 [Hydra vulgaris]|uniref:uncharacterized protein LOC105847596 n=1 Tax=Hydra vulgaris TaxID=6087 RepID=UPI0032EA8463
MEHHVKPKFNMKNKIRGDRKKVSFKDKKLCKAIILKSSSYCTIVRRKQTKDPIGSILKFSPLNSPKNQLPMTTPATRKSTFLGCIGIGVEFRCNNGQCISRFSICNGRFDCIDSSDEDPSLCRGNQLPMITLPTRKTRLIGNII